MKDPAHVLKCKKLAALVGTGAAQEVMLEQLGVTKHALTKLLADPETEQAVAELGDEIIKEAKQMSRREMAKMSGLALKALEANLRKHSMEAVKVVLQITGVLAKDQAPEAAAGITVVMPGATLEQPQVIEIPSDSGGQDD